MNRIRELREEKRITQVRLSIELEVSQETISAYEMGKYYPSVKSLLKLRDIFGTSIDYILGLSDLKYESAPFSSINTNELALLQNYRRLGPQGRERVNGYIDGYLDALKYQDNMTQK